jgi:phosphonate transport system ATP-binding protein
MPSGNAGEERDASASSPNPSKGTSPTQTDRKTTRGAAIRVEHLTKVYPDGTVALNDLSFTVSPGEFLVVIGLSGSGKSTLMRCLNRLIEPTSGKIFIDDVDITALNREEMRKLRRRIGMIFQQFNLVKRMPVLTNVLAGRLGYLPPSWSLLNFFPRDEVRRAMSSLGRVGIPEKAGTRADQLSGGQQQRVGIARALMQEPSLILADEPVASLDPATSHSVLKYVEELNKHDGITVLCSLHFLSLARRYGTRVIALRAGEMVFDGLPADLDERKFKTIYGEEAVEVEIA